MESKTHAPSFTVSLRGYDRMEVDEYLDSLAEALGQVEEAEDVNRGLRNHIERLNARIADLEERISSDTPRTGAVLGERIAILLGSAEETAAETIARADKQAAEMLEKAHEDVAQAEDQARGAIVRGEEQARRIEAAARAEAAEIVSEAEARATARTRQIEQWAEQVVSHTRGEEARMLTEQQQKRDASEEELRRLAQRRDAVAGTITDLRAALGEALGLVGPPAALPAAVDPAGDHVSLPVPELTSGAAAAVTEDDDEAEGRDAADAAAEHGEEEQDADRTGQIEAITGIGADPDAIGAADASGAADSIGAADLSGDARGAADLSGAADSIGAVSGRSEEQSEGPTEAVPGQIDLDDEEVGSVRIVAADDVDSDDVDEMPWPAAFHPFDDYESSHTGGIELRDSARGGAEPDEFDTKFDAWVTGSEGPRHFRKL